MRSVISAAHQLSLPIAEGASAPTPPHSLRPPIPTEGGAPFDDEDRFFEPWWPGAPAFVRLAGGRLELRTGHLSDPLDAFPELRGLADQLLADGLIVEGTLLALDAEGRPDESLLRRCLAEGRPSGGREAEGAFVAADLPWLEGRSLARRSFGERRRQLAAVLRDGEHGVLSRGLVGEGRMLARAVSGLGLEAISARRLEARWRPGPAGDDWLRLPVERPVVMPPRPFLVVLERLPLGE